MYNNKYLPVRFESRVFMNTVYALQIHYNKLRYPDDNIIFIFLLIYNYNND